MAPACSPTSPGLRGTMMSILLFSGLCSCLHHYHFIEELKTWEEAQKYCRENYTDLATIDNEEDMEQLIATAGSGYEGKVWIGMYDILKSWIWSQSSQNLYVEGQQKFTSWKEGRPKEMKEKLQLCVVFQNGVWTDAFCEEQKPFVCYDRVSYLPQLETYDFVNNRMTWEDAKNYCKARKKNLAMVRSEEESVKIRQEVPEDEEVWIDLTRHPWSWWSDEDDDNSKFSNWENGHPLDLNKSCAATVINATRLGKWVENHCEDKLPFMCHNNKRQLFHFKLTALKSTIDLSRSAVTEAILNLLKEKMKEKGITRDFKISFITKPDGKIFRKEEEKVNAVRMKC